jgi:hypothetical protein
MSRIVGHYAPRVLAVLVGVLVGLTLVPAAAAAVAWYALLALLGVALLLGLAMLVHNRGLCEHCIASLPLDAAGTAQRQALRFRVAHLFESRLFALGYLAALVTCGFVSTNPVGRYGWAAAEGSLGYLVLVYLTHQRLQPWCPYCRNGGEEHLVPTTPEPVPTHV